jgi:WD40 repeat protein
LRKGQPEGIIGSSPYKSETDELMSISLSHSAKYFVTGGGMGVVRIYDYQSSQFVSEHRAHSGCITKVAFSPDDKQIVSTGRDGLIAVWNVFL